MPVDADRIREDFQRQVELLGYLAGETRNFQEWNQGRWTEIVALIHELLLDRNELIGWALGQLRDLWGKDKSLQENPLSLVEEQDLLVQGLELLEAGSRRQAFQTLRRVRSANVWWRARGLELLHSFDPDQAEPCAAFQRVAAAKMANLGGVEIQPHEADVRQARLYEPPGVMLGEKGERKILVFHLPRELAAGPPALDREHGDRELEATPAPPEPPPAPPQPSPAPPIGEISWSEPPAEPVVETVRRTPHIDLQPDAPVAPGSEFQVEIFADTAAARAGELADDIVIRAPSDVKEFFLDVWFYATGHFEIAQKAVDKLRIHRDEPVSNRLTFNLRVRSAGELEAMRGQLGAFHKGSVGAAFSFQNRPCGRVDRVVALDVPEQPAPGLEARAANRAMVPPPGNSLALRPGEPQPDMVVEVVEDEISDGRTYQCKVSTALGSTTSTWRQKQDGTTWQIMSSYMANFTKSGKSPGQLVAALRGAGIKMFEASPSNFQKSLWQLIDAGQAPKTIQIVTEEPHFLWELMVPTRGAERREPLGVEFTVGRWVTASAASPHTAVPIRDSYVVAPSYPGRRELKHAESEAEMICDDFEGEAIKPASYDSITEKLEARKVSLLHFACHGKAQDNNVMQALELDDGGELTATELEGSEAFHSYFREKQPLVFLNACEVGRQQAALAGAGGFPAVMIGLGARAVIAPAWSVKDTIAHKIAVEFYTALKNHPEKPLAAIFQEIRRRAYHNGGEDTYAAYCFYGSPMATRRP